VRRAKLCDEDLAAIEPKLRVLKRAFGHDIRGSTLEEQLQFVHFESRGCEQAAGRPCAKRARREKPMTAAAYQASAGASFAVNSHKRVQTHIGAVNAYGTDTADGSAVAAGMRDELNQNGLIAQSAWGMA
jgi:hypothetical protein